jgi:hypothetical protein
MKKNEKKRKALHVENYYCSIEKNIQKVFFRKKALTFIRLIIANMQCSFLFYFNRNFCIENKNYPYFDL